LATARRGCRFGWKASALFELLVEPPASEQVPLMPEAAARQVSMLG
jgi:hypothetical protein